MTRTITTTMIQPRRPMPGACTGRPRMCGCPAGATAGLTRAGPCNAVPIPFDLKDLAQRYDADGRQVYVSLYADLGDDRHGDLLARRHREIRAALTGNDERAALDDAMRRAMASY